VTILRPTYIV